MSLEFNPATRRSIIAARTTMPIKKPRRGSEPKPRRLRLGVLHGDARVLAAELPANSVNVTITSPPYFDVKDYGTAKQIARAGP